MSSKQIKNIRKVLGLTQQKMVDFIGCRQHTVARWETGEMEPRGANLKLLRELAEKANRKRRKSSNANTAHGSRRGSR